MRPREFEFGCTNCGRRSAPTFAELESQCCRAPYEIVYSSKPGGRIPRLPLRTERPAVTLGEGNTPLVELRRTGSSLGLARLWAKLEFVSPTGSFKDRGSAVLVSAASDGGVTEFVEDSSGNAGASIAAYAAAAIIKVHVFVPATAARGKLDQIAVFGAELHEIDGPRQAATDAAREFVAQHGLPYLSHSLSPFFVEGMKGFAYEVDGSAASGVGHILFPVGNGSLLLGARKGFDEVFAARRREALPRLHAVQAEAVRPIVAALRGEAGESSTGRTIASGISVSRPPRLRQVVAAVQSTAGSGVAVPDSAILGWQRRLAATEGIFCEATSAAAFAGLEELLLEGVILPGSEVLVPITGAGLKEPLPTAK